MAFAFQVLDFLGILNILAFGKTFYKTLKKERLDKTIWMVWSDMQKTDIEGIKRRQKKGIELKLAGDGQFDSRGVKHL